jgi:hypothetical protein
MPSFCAEILVSGDVPGLDSGVFHAICGTAMRGDPMSRPEPAFIAADVPVPRDPRTDAALASIEAKRRAAEHSGAIALYALFAFGAAAQQGRLARAVAFSRGLCIVATGFIPVALFWTLVWPG